MLGDDKNKNFCGVITPIGPGHEQAYQELCLQSIRVAMQKSKGPFDEILIIPVWDLDGKIGRSKARNIGANIAHLNNIEWIFFLDADDFMFEAAFENVSEYIDKYDAIWGQIVEMPYNAEDSMKIREGQISLINDFETLVHNDPFYTLQMGHFVRTAIAVEHPFDEIMDTGEDFKYYLEVWKNHRCLKCDDLFFINVRGNHSTGPRCANGTQWRLAVEHELNMYKN